MKGIFKPKNKQKYIGNPDNVIFRSSWELSFMNFIDRSDVVVKWASEEISFRYYLITDKKWHRYFPDFYLELITGDKFIIEIKPFNERIIKKKNNPHIVETFIKNQSKWKSAKEIADENNLKFIILDEYDLKKIGVRIPLKSTKIPKNKLLYESQDQFSGSVQTLTEPLIEYSKRKK